LEKDVKVSLPLTIMSSASKLFDNSARELPMSLFIFKCLNSTVNSAGYLSFSRLASKLITQGEKKSE